MKHDNSKKETIIENAISMFYKLGYKKCTLRKIAESSGISHVTIFKHFKNKHDLASILIERYLEGLVSVTQDFVKQNALEPNDNFEIILFYWSAHNYFLTCDQNFTRFYVGYYNYDYKWFNDIHTKYAKFIFNKLFNFNYHKSDVYRHLDIDVISKVQIELIDLYFHNKLTYYEIMEYFIDLFIKLLNYKREVSIGEIHSFINRHILCDDYMKYDIFNDFLCNSTPNSLISDN